MLLLKKIVKKYITGDQEVDALKGVSLSFRKSEFVAILGPSGCGKTTLLNIIGGLDQYTSGDLIINGKSTKEYKDADWDTYRNHEIGFVFQSYNLIPHQSVLSNVELALTLSGIGKDERRKRAIEALEKVGLKDQINKRPNQLSGGQMQRVAIARALVNNPNILLADEPTGALDSETSVQIMDILKEVAKDKLVIMVTHNPELAELYATRIIKLLDGNVVNDSMPFEAENNLSNDKTSIVKKDKKKSMSFFTALSLSINNLLTKKGRTILTAFAGSIGIIGIALIMSVSSGVNAYIDTVEQNTMSNYPITIEETAIDMTSMMTAYMDSNKEVEIYDGYITSNNVMSSMLDQLYNMISTNNLKKFKAYIESDECDLEKYTADIKYSYSAHLNTYFETVDKTTNKKVYKRTYSGYQELYRVVTTGDTSYSSPSNQNNLFSEIIGDKSLFDSQYEFIYGNYPTNKNEVLIVADENNQISDLVLYSLGLMNINELISYQKQLTAYTNDPEHNEKPVLPNSVSYTYQQLCEYQFKVLLDSDFYKINDLGYIDDYTSYKSNPNDYLVQKLDNTENILKICGIVRPSEQAISSNSSGGILYTKELMPDLIEQVNSSDVVKLQLDNPNKNMILGTEFIKEYTTENISELFGILPNLQNNESLMSKISYADLMKLQSITNFTDPQSINIILEFANKYLLSDQSEILKQLGYVDLSSPTKISIYPKDFNSKDGIINIIKNYNEQQTDENKLTYNDMVGLLLSSITIIVDAISYVLIAFVSISLVVSSIMIGIITYISVLERTKEIGILRSIGASKKDVSRVFNAESITVGFTAGVFGIVMSLILIIPINIILHHLTGISYLSAKLPLVGSIFLVAISVLLTFIAGLIPSKFASKKDPVIALRSE